MSEQALSVAELILSHLAREGVTSAFGIPGGSATPLFDAAVRSEGLRLVGARHESGAAFMAAGYARMSGRVGACLLTTGPGATNALTGVCAARADGLPMLVVTAQAASTSAARLPLQDSSWDGVDTVAIFKPACKLSAALVEPKGAGAVVRHALRAAMTGRRGPVHLSVPTDVLAMPSGGDVLWPSEYRPIARCVDLSAAREAARLLARARRPAILAGSGVALAEAQPELMEVAELLGAATATTPKGKGVFPEDHYLSLRVFGMAGSPWAEQYLLSGECDVLLVVGSSMHEVSTQGWDRRLRPSCGLIQADVDPGTIGRSYPVDVALVGDAKAALKEVARQLRRLLRHGPDRAGGEVELWKRSRAAVLPVPAEDGGARGLKPQTVARELDAAAPHDAVIVLDVGSHALWAVHHMTARGRRVFSHNWGQFASMGYAASAVGAKLARPDLPVVAVVGDGGFAMTGMEVSTAVTERVPVVWVVFNDGRLGTVHHGQRLQYGRHAATEFAAFDAAGVAEALGATGFRVRRPGETAAALKAALACKGPAVVDVRVDPEEPPPIHSRVKLLRAAGAVAA